MCKCNPNNYNQECHGSGDCRWIGERMGKEYPPYEEEVHKMKLTSKMKKALIGPLLLIVAITLYVCAFPFLAWYLTGLMGMVFTAMDLAKPIAEWFDRDGLR